MRWVIFFILSLVRLYGDDDSLPLSNIDTQSITMVEGVNVISGYPHLADIDLAIPSVQPITFSHSYITPCGNSKPHIQACRLGYEQTTFTHPEKHGDITFIHDDSSGSRIKFRGIPGGISKLRNATSMSNIGGGYIGGKTNEGNRYIQHIPDSHIEIHDGSGVTTELVVKGQTKVYDSDKKRDFYRPIKTTYPNQYSILYEENNHTVTISYTNPAGNVFHKTSSEYLAFTKKEKEERKKKGLPPAQFVKTFPLPDGRNIKYEFSKKECDIGGINDIAKSEIYYIDRVERPSSPSIRYTYTGTRIGEEKYPLLTEKKFDDHHYVRYDYSSNKNGEVSQILLPDKEGSPVTAYQLELSHSSKYGFYINGSCKLKDAEGHVTEYFWDFNRMLTEIKYPGEKEIESKEKFVWKESGDVKLSHLISHSFTDSKDSLLYKREYDYDNQGNVLKDSFVGSLTGEKNHDTLVKTFTYSDDGLNNVISESNGRITLHYTYLPSTNLVASILKEYDGKIIHREFFAYDSINTLFSHIEDDGSAEIQDNLTGVTTRKITKYKNRTTMPCYGLPEEIEEKAFNLQTGEEELFLKKKRVYSPEGWLEKEDVYDALGQFAYGRSFTYHPFGKPEEEVDPLGYITKKVYNSIGELTQETREGKTISYSYDNQGHLISKAIGPHHESYLYNKRGLKEKEINEFGHTTSYKYDKRKRQTEMTHPDGAIAKVSYNPEGHPHKTTDEEGHVTETTFNCYKKPLRIKKSDGSITQHFYQLQGNLEKTIHPDGTYTCYTYDGFDHLLTEDHFSKEGALLSHQEKKYQGFILVEETDPCGKVTRYSHDCFGRKIRQECEDTLITYSYDTLNRLAEERQYIEGDYLSHKFSYDLLDRITEERWEDSKGNLLRYAAKTYDPFGNIITETNGTSTTCHEYDSLNRLIKTTDPNGNTTTFTYGSIERNGHLVKTLTTIDPSGTTTLEIYNLRDKVEEKTVLSPCGETLYTEHMTYDKCARLTQATRTLPTGETNHTKITYDSLGQQIAYTQAAGTNDESTIKTTYNSLGNIITTTKPDGTTLHYTYTPLQHVHTLHSSDGSVRYEFTYDLCGRLLTSHDLNTGKTLTRTYDIQGRLLREILPNDHMIEYTYDPLGRRLTVTIDQNKTIHYVYDPCYLREVHYRDRCYRYHTYDLAGRLLKADTLTLDRDTAGRITAYRSGDWSATNILYDPCNNLLSYLHDNTPYNFSYDHLNQLIEEKNHHYTYNAFHNRIEKDGIHFQYNAQHQNLLHTHDKNGNLLFDGLHHYTYDALDRLTSIDSLPITYDSLHRRMTKGDTAYLYMGECEIGSTNGEFRVLGLGKLAESGASVFIEWNGTLSTPSHDLQGSLVSLNNLTAHYTAYGEGPCPFPWGYQGKRHDPENNTYFFGRRSYDPSTGRWTTKDPAKDGFNHYAFVLNNPLANFDAFGLYIEGRPSGFNPFFFIWNFAFNFIETIGNHLIPLPGLSNIIGGIGRLGQGTLAWNPSSYEPSHVEKVGPGDSPNQYTVYFNGMQCKPEEAVTQALERSKELGQPVYLCYTASHGFIQDLIGCVLQKLGITLQCDRVSAQLFNKLSENSESTTPIHALAFSRGTMTCDNGAKTLSLEYRKKFVTAQGVGGAIRFQDEDYKHTMNYESPRDWVTWGSRPYAKFLEAIGWVPLPDNLEIVECRATGLGRFFDHEALGPSYGPAWNKSINRIQNDF